MQNPFSTPMLKTIAKIGFTAKGLVYCLLGILVFMAAFEIGRQAGKDVDKESAFNVIEHLPAGKWLLAIVALGLLCYVLWRVVQAFLPSRNDDSKIKNISKKIRYLLSGLVYLSLALFAIKMVFENSDDSGSKQHVIEDIMHIENGSILIGLAAFVIAAVGIYQIYYSLSEGYKKHVSLVSVDRKTRDMLLLSGKLGYVARGVVWLIIAWLFSKAAWYSNAAEAGDTAKAFRFLESASYGSYFLGALGLGLLCYGLFNFIRARYETFS
jgi:type IV secretory pathway VirB2 component (pilin)